MGDVSFRGKRLSAMVVVDSHNAKQLLNKQLKGIVIKDEKVKVFYNPKKPNKSFLINGSYTQVIFTVAMMIFMGLITIRCIERLRVL